ncbi:hypothetical protein KY284_000703 [Solanum tuberosum]|nr:hypothetical protein KY284_000703 [Solanum tuberosum]
MSQSVALKKKGSNPNKAQSPLKNMNFDMQYRSSTELANQLKIKREQLANERNDKAKKEHAPIAHKIKNSEDFIPQQGKSKLVEYKSVIQSSSREELGTSHMVVGKGQTKKSLFQSGESIQEKGIKLPMHNFRFQTSSQKGEEEQHDIQDLLNLKQVKRKSVLPATSLDQFLEEQQLQKEHDINDLPNCKQVKRKSVIPATSLDQFLEEQQLQKEHDINDLPNCKQVKRKSVIPATSLDQFQKKQAIHIGDETKTNNHTVADDLVDQEEIGRDKCAIDEEIGIDCSTKGILEPKKVRGKTTCKDIHARNLEERKEVTFDKGQAVGPTGKIVSELTNFIGTISRNPRFINLMYTSWHASKFLIPVEGKKWVMTGLRDAWKRHKQKIKERYFDKNSTVEDMPAKRPNDMPEGQFRQLIKYWKHPNVQAELQNHQNSGETTDDAFTAVFGKEQPGQLRCYGRSVTTSSLKKDEETNKLKQKHANEITSLKEEMNEMREEMRHFFSQLLQNNPGLNVQDMPGCVGSNIASPIDASSAQVVKGQNLPHSSGSTYDPILQKVFHIFSSVLFLEL